MAAYDYARTLPYVDGSRMILAGQSAGEWRRSSRRARATRRA